MFIKCTLVHPIVAAGKGGVLLISGPDTHSQGEDMASKKTTPKKAVAKKPAPAKKTSAPKSKKQSAGKTAAPKAAPAKKPGRPSKKVAQKPQAAAKPQAATNSTFTNGSASTVTISPSGFAPTAIPSNISVSVATGSVPPESIRKQIAESLASNAPVRKNIKKKSRIRRFFGFFKRAK